MFEYPGHTAMLKMTFVGLALALVATFSGPVLAATSLTPGESVTYSCPTELTGTFGPNEVTLRCAPLASASLLPTPSPSPVPTATSPSPVVTPSPTPTPQPTASPTSQPTPSPTPLATPTPPPSDSCSTIKGYGSSATGGTKLVTVTTVAALKGALTAGNHVRIAGGTYDVNGRLDLPSNFTLEAVPGQRVTLTDASIFVRANSNIIVRNLGIHSSDRFGNAGDIDAINLNGLRGSINRVAISNVTAIWGPDIGGLAILGDVNDVTVQCSILGEGLRFSNHHEGGAPDGHSMGLSVFQLDTNVDPADRLTFWGNLLTTSDRRMPVIHGARLVDWVNNVSYNFGRNGPDGNPRSMNYIGNLVKAGPISDVPNDVWRSRPHSANPCCYANSVYLAANLVAGMPYRESLTSGVRASAPFPLSVSPIPASNVQAFIVANAGPLVRDATDNRLIGNFVNGTGDYMDAADVP